MKINVNDNDFQKEVIERSKETPVLVDFWAAWCGPCMMLGPVIEKAIDTDELRKKVVLAKADTNECRVTSNKYGVRSIPNIQLFKDGNVVAQTIGFRPLEQIRAWIQNNI